MKSFVLLILSLVIITFVAGCQVMVIPITPVVLSLSTSLRTPLPTPLPTPTPIAAPARLQIPRIGLDTNIEAVGQTEAGQMGTPQKLDNVAWYKLGATPGERGNAVISGHLDDPKGPAVFWKLDKLKPGDKVIVVDVTGMSHTFAVIATERYPDDAAPIDKIFGFDMERDLNLITCDGVWDRKAHRYKERLVVYTRLVAEAG